jgi:hypothetical protein
MEFGIWIETHLAGRILERKLVATLLRTASGIVAEEIRLSLEEGKAVLPAGRLQAW